MDDRPLFSDRQGRARELANADLAKLLFAVLERFEREGYFLWALGPKESDYSDERVGGALMDPEDFFDRRLRTSEPWPYVTNPSRGRKVPPFWARMDEDLLFDTLEVIHDAVISAPLPVIEGQKPVYSQLTGRERFREALNEVFALRTPPAEMLDTGEIVERGPEELHALVQEPLPTARQPDETSAVVEEAVELFRKRRASLADRQAAVQILAGGLERLRSEAHRRLQSRDENDLFNIANNFAIRHQNARQRTDYDRALYLEWLFYWYLATIRLLVRIRAERAVVRNAGND